MNLGTVLVLVGTILAALDFLTDANTNGTWYGNRRILVLGVVLIGIGVLVGAEPFVTE